ncbi:hypothetical protein BDR03DRAFT_988004 [Suillus americanus]|nr:hypothetical protein BDR03DRAFT_988004 [Suillus americanus]
MMVSHSVSNNDVVFDVVLQLLASLTLSANDAHNLIQVIVDSTGLESPGPSAASPTTDAQTLVSPAAQTLPTIAPAAQALPPTPPAVQPLPPVAQPLPPAAQALSPVPPAAQALSPAPPGPAPPTHIDLPNPNVHNEHLPDLPTSRVMVNGEEHLQQHYKGFTFDIPHPDARGPFYIVTRGRRVGIFNTWTRTSPHVLGVSCSSYTRARSWSDGVLRMLDAIKLEEARWLP